MSKSRIHTHSTPFLNVDIQKNNEGTSLPKISHLISKNKFSENNNSLLD